MQAAVIDATINNTVTSQTSVNRPMLLATKARFGRAALIDVAGACYGIAMTKFVLRDSLSSDTGFQAYIELAAIVVSFGITLLVVRGSGRRFKSSIPTLCFAIFGVLAIASSWRSFSPPFSFVKGVLLVAVMATAYWTGQTGLGPRYLRATYWAFVGMQVIGLIVGVLFPTKFPLFMIDEFSGRTKLSLFATHPGIMAETCGIFILAAPLLQKKPHWISVVFLFVLNLLAGEKAATGVLIFLLLIRFAANYDVKRVWRTTAVVLSVAVLGSVGFYVAALGFGSASSSVADGAAKIYGTQTAVEAQSFDGRGALWQGAVGLISGSPVFGFGVDGAREKLIHIVWWSGAAHNGYLQSALDSGLMGGSILVAGIIGVLFACINCRRDVRNQIVPLLGYIMISACVGGILTDCLNLGLFCLLWSYYLARSNPRLGTFKAAWAAPGHTNPLIAQA